MSFHLLLLILIGSYTECLLRGTDTEFTVHVVDRLGVVAVGFHFLLNEIESQNFYENV